MLRRDDERPELAAALEDNGFILAKEGDFLVIDSHGHAHRLTERTAGAESRAIAGKLTHLSTTPLPTVQEGKEMIRGAEAAKYRAAH